MKKVLTTWINETNLYVGFRGDFQYRGGTYKGWSGRHLEQSLREAAFFVGDFYDIEKLTTEYVNGFRDDSCLWR